MAIGTHLPREPMRKAAIADDSRPDRERRVDVCKAAILITSDGHEFPVTIRDVSATGFRIETEETPLIGEKVLLRVDKYGEFAAQIRWALGQEAGGIFLEALDDPT